MMRDQKKRRFLLLRLWPTEYDALQVHARRCGHTMNSMLRSFIYGLPTWEANREEKADGPASSAKEPRVKRGLRQ